MDKLCVMMWIIEKPVVRNGVFSGCGGGGGDAGWLRSWAWWSGYSRKIFYIKGFFERKIFGIRIGDVRIMTFLLRGGCGGGSVRP